MSKATDEIKLIAERTDKILLFHSATGKDSIAMLDLCAPFFKEIVCVYMYTVPNLLSVNRYIRWAEATYPNCHFIQCPHFSVSSYIRSGFLGCAKNPKQKLLNLVDITEIARQKTGIQWAAFGMKEADSLQRRVFLRTYAAMCHTTPEGVLVAVDIPNPAAPEKCTVLVGGEIYKQISSMHALIGAIFKGGLLAFGERLKQRTNGGDVPLTEKTLQQLGFKRTEGINWKTQKMYPLHLYKHKDIEKYIQDRHLITNVDYFEGKRPKATSNGECIYDVGFLNYLRNHFPSDLKQVYAYFPEARYILLKYDQGIAESAPQLPEIKTETE